MKKIGSDIRLSASDLVAYLNCNHLTELDLAVLEGKMHKPDHYDPLLEILRERGRVHEAGYLEYLRSKGLQIVEIDGVDITESAVNATLEAMRQGADIIAQGALELAPWAGRLDILSKVSGNSKFGDWQYEVVDTKLARETKGGTILQLCLYADLLTRAQNQIPEYIHVVSPWSEFEPQSYRYPEFAAYFRRVKKAAESAIDSDYRRDFLSETYPEPKAHCDVCQWHHNCDARRRDDDHLCLVAGITKTQINELKAQGIQTLAALAAMPLPMTWRPTRGALASFERVREQARIQHQARQRGEREFELLPIVEGFGLAALPEPSPGDIFFDIESDQFVGEHGIEYLFGYGYFDASGAWCYVQDWALYRDSEKTVFERFMDVVTQRRKQYPESHIYHYAPYEPGALKRLMGRYASREDALDQLLRGKALVDLYAIVKHALRASVESYSLKKMEPFFGFERQVSLRDANSALTRLSASLELNDIPAIDDAVKKTVAAYNEDDCRSTAELRTWLEALRDQQAAAGHHVPRPESVSSEPSEELSERDRRVQALKAQLTQDVPADLSLCTDEQWARWVLAHCLDWHRREDKAAWWEFFRLKDLSADDLTHERAGLSDLTFVETIAKSRQGIPTDRYSFIPQDTDFRGDEKLKSVGGDTFGTVEAISFDDLTVDIKKSKATAELHPEAVFSHQVIGSTAQAQSLLRLGEHVAENGLFLDDEFASAKALLLRKKPAPDGQLLVLDGETTLDAAVRLAQQMECGVLAVQGPPGTGKSYTGAHMICEFVRAGKKVGITANSHKVIRGLINTVMRAARMQGLSLVCGQKPEQGNQEDDTEQLIFLASNDAMRNALDQGRIQVGAGTHFMWAADALIDGLDVLVVDEAAQMSLANVLAVSPAAPLLIMLGDPCQLDQPMQGTHPEGAGVSALGHVLNGKQTITPDQGLFLETTWRMHPAVCDFISEMFYESKLHAKPGTEKQRISHGIAKGAGLRYLPVQHQGNTSSSLEEVEAVVALVKQILSDKPQWVDREGNQKDLSIRDILIIAPYNAQVFEIQQRLPEASVGTVDKFQGQEAPIVIYSMATSSYEDAPRGMEFLYSANRLNVAISRAKCLAVLVASPTIFEVQCNTPRQMQLANAYCRYLETCDELPKVSES